MSTNVLNSCCDCPSKIENINTDWLTFVLNLLLWILDYYDGSVLFCFMTTTCVLLAIEFVEKRFHHVVVVVIVIVVDWRVWDAHVMCCCCYFSSYLVLLFVPVRRMNSWMCDHWIYIKINKSCYFTYRSFVPAISMYNPTRALTRFGIV